MSRASRRALIDRIEQHRQRRLVVYVTSDRPPAPGQIGEDAVRPLYEQLRAVGHVEKLDFFIYSRGGAIDVPWRMVTGIRTAADEWSVLIPFRANSAATLIALGADEIVLGRNGELGPIDPSMNVQRAGRPGPPVQESISVEDVMAYVRFARDRVGLSDQAALATALGKLTERLDAATLGSVYRTHSHIRDVARRMLLSRKRSDSQQVIATIIETLAERVYAHGHAIGLRTAKEIGLPAVAADQALDDMLWELLLEYENDLKLLQPIDPAVAIQHQDRFVENNAVLALLESTAAVNEFKGDLVIQATRQMPQNLNLTVNLNLIAPQVPAVAPVGPPAAVPPAAAPGGGPPPSPAATGGAATPAGPPVGPAAAPAPAVGPAPATGAPAGGAAAPAAGGPAPAGGQQQLFNQMLQQFLQQAQQALVQQAQQAAQQALRDQAPIIQMEVAVRNGRWVRSP